mmetsp:Transcript_18335/g.25436  ORF Transcript_18335/g.25436 Transcript_18335/m.25436 type:complete len:279 (-) Transcript_18335:49-885(-)
MLTVMKKMNLVFSATSGRLGASPTSFLTSNLRKNKLSMVLSGEQIIQSRSLQLTSKNTNRRNGNGNDNGENHKNNQLHFSKRRKPTLEVARAMPLSCQEMDNASLITLAALKNHSARTEVLKRHIMVTDEVNYEEACRTFAKVAHYNRKGMLMHTVPYKIGIVAALGGAFASVPLCFHYDTVSYFNESYVTADVPDAKDLETFLEVGSWAWNWMEPVLGQISFFLLCLQYSRSQLKNLGIKPYTHMIKDMRANQLAQEFPRYDAKILKDYSKTDNFYS